MLAVAWVLRTLLGVGGALLVYSAWPVVWGSWQALGASTVVDQLRNNKPTTRASALAAIAALDRAVQANPTAQRYLDRSELLAGLSGALKDIGDDEREQWLRAAETDLETGLAGMPGHGIGWLRLASVRQALDGPSRRVVDPLLLSIDTAPVEPRLWPVRLELILRNLQLFSDAETERVAAYVEMTWKASSDRRWFVRAMREPLDELFIRMLLAKLPNAQDELSMWIQLVRP